MNALRKCEGRAASLVHELRVDFPCRDATCLLLRFHLAVDIKMQSKFFTIFFAFL